MEKARPRFRFPPPPPKVPRTNYIQLRAIFKEAATNAPALIFIDELDAIAPKRDDV